MPNSTSKALEKKCLIWTWGLFSEQILSRADNLSYIEHIFEISRRPDLLTRVIEYRTTVLKISEDDEIDTKLTRIPSAKKYKGNTLEGSNL